MRLRLLCTDLLCAILAAALPGPGAAAASQVEDGDALTVRLVTVAPGTGTLSRFGHGALWIHDAGSGADDAWTFGRSDAHRFTFMSLLLQGRAEVVSDHVDAQEMLERYAAQGRNVRIQTLDLAPSERARLRDVLEVARGPFRYHLFRSNCTTRLRDALDAALDGRLHDLTASRPSPRTLRAWSGDYMADDRVLAALSGLILAGGMDQPISVWEEMFLPARLAERLAELGLAHDVEALASSRPMSLAGPPNEAVALALGLALGTLLVLLGRSRAAVGFSLAAASWCLAAGGAGLALLAGWAFTGEPLMAWNQNLLQANPLVLLVPMAAWGSWRNREFAGRAALLVAGIACVGLLVELLPGLDQSNGFVLAFAIPAHAGLALGMRSFASR